MSGVDSYTDYAYNIIKDICEKFGPRYSSSEAEKKANLWIKEEFSKVHLKPPKHKYLQE